MLALILIVIAIVFAKYFIADFITEFKNLKNYKADRKAYKEFSKLVD